MAWTLGRTPDLYTLPSVEVEGAAWLAGGKVESFSLERELVASVIPGNIRGRQGLSVGTADVDVTFEDRVTPWSTDPARRVAVRAPVRLFVSDDGDELDLGSWVIAPTSGSLTSTGVALELLEAQSVGKQIAQALPPHQAGPFVTKVDPAWVVGRMADQAGFPPVPRPVASALLAVPLHGSFTSVPVPSYPVPLYSAGGAVTTWEVIAGDVAVGAGPASSALLVADGAKGQVISDVFLAGSKAYITLNVVGTVTLSDTVQGWQIRITNSGSTHTIEVCNSADDTFTAPVSYAAGSSADWPTRVQLELTRTQVPIPDTNRGQWGSFSVRARSSHTAAWSAAASDATTYNPGPTMVEAISVVAGATGRFAALQVSTVADPALWAPSQAHLQPIGGDMGLPWVPAGTNVWPAIQDVCSAWLAAGIVGNDGIFRLLSRDDLAGVNSLGEDTDVGQEWDDLKWTLDSDDTVDRVQVTFTPPQVKETVYNTTTLAPEVWRAEDVIKVAAGATVTIPAAFDNLAAVALFTNFTTPTAPSVLWAQTSTLIAFNNPDGSGSPLDNGDWAATVVQTSSTTATITIRNRTASPMYLVDGNGEPALILRAQLTASYETAQVVERGAPAEVAQSPLEVDLTPWVQSADEAARIADYLYARLRGKALWKASSVRCRLDWSHDIGKVLRLRHEESGLVAKALITKVALAGQPGEIGQTLDLVLLPWTYADHAATFAGQTYADHAVEQAGATYADHAANPLHLS